MALSGKQKFYLANFISIAIFLTAAHIIGDMTRAEIPNWYRTLAKPPLNPPDFVFPVVWTTLYIMMAIAAVRVFDKRKSLGRPIRILFVLQTLLNWGWSYVFFGFHLLGCAFIWLLILDAIVAALILMLLKKDRVAALLLVPYFLWGLFASYLNGAILFLNP